MLEFDFRNGNLRRKYDGLKYSIKSIEDITFELSLVNDVQVPVVAAVDRDSMDKEALDEQAAKRIRVEDDINKPQSINDDSSSRSSESFSLVDVAGIDLIKERMEKLDKRREDVIKMSRDVQKLAKQSIFSVHRGQVADAMAKLSSARTCAENIMTIVNEVSVINHVWKC